MSGNAGTCHHTMEGWPKPGGLRELAAQATPGDWKYDGELYADQGDGTGPLLCATDADARLVALAPEMATLLDEVFTEHWKDIDPELREQFTRLNEKARG